MSETPTQNGKAFISYSRKDKEFVKKLEASLEAHGVVTWVDWEGIPLSADWMAEITAAIEGADAFLFVISPDSLASQVCGEELELGLKYNKKLVPILHRVPEKGQPMHERVSATNWVYLRPEDDFDATMPKLVETINTDLDWVRQHTRLLERAVEWDGKKRNGSFLLHGSDLEDAERWMADSSGGLTRQVVPLQAEYIRASRQQAQQRQRVMLAGISVALIISIVLAIAAVFQSIAAQRNAELAANNASTAVANEQLAKANEQRANDNALLAQNNASTAQASEKLALANEKLASDNAILAQNNASTAVANEQARATQQAIAVENEQLAKESERRAIAQRGAAQAQLVQQQPAQLFISTLLALFSIDIFPSQVGEEVLRGNLSLMSIPQATFQQGAAITSVSFSPDGKQVLSSGKNLVAYLWDARSGEKVAELVHDGPVNSATYSPDGQWIATGSSDGSARLWKADGSPVKSFTLFDEPIGVSEVKFSPDGLRLAIAQDNGIVSIVEIGTEKIIRQLPHNGKIYDIGFSRDGKRLFAATESGSATVWNPNTGTSFVTVKHAGDVYQAAFSPDAQYIVTASRDQTTKVVKINNGVIEDTLKHDDWVEGVAYSPDGYNFATAADDNTVRVWEAESWREILRLRHEGFAQHVVYDPNGWYLASSSVDGTARVWDPVSGVELVRLPLDGKGGPLAFSFDSKKIVTSNEAGELRVWNLNQLDSLLVSIINNQLVRSIKFSRDDRWLVSGTDDSLVTLWDMPSLLTYALSDVEEIENNRIDYLDIYSLPSGFIRSLFFSPVSDTIGIVSEGIVTTVNLNDPTDYREQRFSGTYFERGTYQPDGQIIAIANSDGEQVELYDPVRQQVVRALPQPGGAYSVSFHPQFANLLAAGGNGGVWLWDAPQGLSLTLATIPGYTLDVDFSHNGQWLAGGSDEGKVFIWKVSYAGGLLTLEQQLELRAGEAINDLEFSPDDTRLATASEDGLARLWDVSTGSEIARLHHPLAAKRATFTHDGNYLATASGKLIFIWDILAIPTFNTSGLRTEACMRLTRNLTAAEWAAYGLPGERQPICPNFP
jgi:WD40 repeat protein